MAVAAVQVATSQEFHSTSSGTTITGSVTVTAGANLLIVFTHNAFTPTTTAVTYNGVAMTLLGSSVATFFSSYKRVYAWYLVDPPTGAAYNIVATWSSARYDYGFTWATFSGYSSIGTVYSNASPTNGTSANGTVTISDWASGDYAVGSNIVNQSGTSGDTAMGNYTSIANDDNYVNSEYQTADGNLNWTHGADVWAACGFAIKGAAGGSVMPIIANHNMRRRA